MMTPDDQTVFQWALVFTMVFYTIIGPERTMKLWNEIKRPIAWFFGKVGF